MLANEPPGLDFGPTRDGFLVNNLLPVTLGNILAGSGLIGAGYWFVYLWNPATPGKS
jgi:formate/nitrite transporter FocA (FNT family)